MYIAENLTTIPPASDYCPYQTDLVTPPLIYSWTPRGEKIEQGMQIVGLFLHSQQASSNKSFLMIVASFIRLIPQPYIGTLTCSFVDTNSNTNTIVLLEGDFSFPNWCLSTRDALRRVFFLIFDAESPCPRQYMLVQCYLSFSRGVIHQQIQGVKAAEVGQGCLLQLLLGS